MSCSEDGGDFDYLFGFGSIMNASTHAPWLQQQSTNNNSSAEEDDDNNQNNNSNNKKRVPNNNHLPGAVATLKSGFGYQRRWNFRSTTGFTALGLAEQQKNYDDNDDVSDINGVVFRIQRSMLPGFDRREVGYERVAVPLEFVEFNFQQRPKSSSQRQHTNFELTSTDRIWLYVPLPSSCSHADENNPLLQSYVDTVLQGCLEWGGEEMAEEFILTTGGWSTFFLNDTPSSRRPWLFRKEYNVIDRLLQKYSEKTHYADRRHPEEFASAMKLRMRGCWSLPRRNHTFTGREEELEQLQSRFSTRDRGRQKVVAVNIVEVAGMGGVGKTQLVTEYCYRNFPSQYGLVVWLNAESSEALVSDYRQLLADLVAEADSTPNKDTDEIVGEVKTRLFRSQIPWLLVFDNLEDRKLLENFVPHGAGQRGHVVVTTRHVMGATELGGELNGSLILGCFHPKESIELLRRAAGPRNMDGLDNTEAAKEISEILGHLPLALGVAGAYMNRCDVTCHEYRDRYIASEQKGQSLLRHGKLQDYSLTVASSLSLSLSAIEKESKVACDILKLLCFLGPDQITKPLLRHLLSSRKKVEEESVEAEIAKRHYQKKIILFVSCGAILAGSTLMRANKQSMVLLTIASFSVASAVAWSQNDEKVESSLQHSVSETSLSAFSPFEYEQADLIWDILKSFSLLSVKEGKGNMHRLLAQALRASQSDSERRFNLKVCVNLMWSLWKFEPEQIETWNESLQILEHAKAVVSHSLDFGFGSSIYTLKTARLSTQVGMFSAMSLNAFIEAQASLELSIKLLDSCSREARNHIFKKARAQALHELGRIFRYEGKYSDSGRVLLDSLRIYEELNSRTRAFNEGIAETLYELGVLEVKKHNLDDAASFLQKSLDMHRTSSTLHQLAAVHVARKPAELQKAKALLQEALGLSRHIGQRAATLKQLARVTIRQGQLDRAEKSLEQALELYIELYGANKLHMNVAAVKFQQGALAIQREQFQRAWLHFAECLRIRRHVYGYARPIGSGDENPTHLEITCVLHELARTEFAQGRYDTATETLKAERIILERLVETNSKSERLFQARLTNITWLQKCAKETGNEDEISQLASDRARMKKMRGKLAQELSLDFQSDSLALRHKAVDCRVLARRFALQKKEGTVTERQEILNSLDDLMIEINLAAESSMKLATADFRATVLNWINKPFKERRLPILNACDSLRNVLRAHGVHVNDTRRQSLQHT